MYRRDGGFAPLFVVAVVAAAGILAFTLVRVRPLSPISTVLGEKKIAEMDDVREKILGKFKISDELEVETGTDEGEIHSKGVGATTRFPLSFDKLTGTLSVTTGNGVKVIRVLPDQASDIAKAAGIQTQIDKIELIQSEEKTVFKIKGKKIGKILGIFPVEIETESEVDAETGAVKTANQSFIADIVLSLVR